MCGTCIAIQQSMQSVLNIFCPSFSLIETIDHLPILGGTSKVIELFFLGLTISNSMECVIYGGDDKST
mgnify:CR=1 FL=1